MFTDVHVSFHSHSVCAQANTHIGTFKGIILLFVLVFLFDTNTCATVLNLVFSPQYLGDSFLYLHASTLNHFTALEYFTVDVCHNLFLLPH